ncbi:MAG: protoporphyrinogen/coproporphyrinogen oxidase [Acidobacteriota bacterium]|jgi:oxygen-dependent protoporphyrinogen oxidase
MTRVVIVGAGVSGLATAWAIRRRDPAIEIVLFERGPRTGGNIRTERIDGYTCEAGPDGFLDTAPATLALVDAIGLKSRLVPSNGAARKRYIFHGGRLCEVPASVGAFLKTPLLSARGKLRVACEPFAGPSEQADESIHDFATRRIGREAASVLVDPMVSGIFAGDPGALSLRGCFPRMWELEQDHGSLFRALLATRRARGRDDAVGAPAGRLTSFDGGMAVLTDTLTRHLGPVVRTSTAVVGVGVREPISLGPRMRSSRRYAVTTTDGILDADAVVLSGPAAESARTLNGVDPVLGGLLRAIPTAPLAVVCLGYNAPDVTSRCELDGFGFLVPANEGPRILGALWETSIYPDRAPANKALLRVMIGGARDPEAVTLPDRELLDIVAGDLAQTMGLSVAPEFVHIVRHPRGIPQYVTGHLARVHQIDTLLEAHPGLCLAGSSYRGVSINACIAEADGIAVMVHRHVRARSSAA